MRIQITADSATTKQTRQMIAACYAVTGEETTVGLNGPECWRLTTPHLTPNQFAQVVARIVKSDGVPLAEKIDRCEERIQVALGYLGEARMMDGDAAATMVDRAADILAGRQPV